MNQNSNNKLKYNSTDLSPMNIGIIAITTLRGKNSQIPKLV